MIKNLFKRIYCFFCPSKRDFELIHNDLKTLHINLFNLLSYQNKIEALVDFFQIIIPIQEKGLIKKAIKNLKRKNYGQNNMIINVLENIQSSLLEIQCSNYSQTSYGEIPTSKTILLGNGFSIPFISIEKLTKKRKIFEKENLDYGSKMTKWEYLNNQSEIFIKFHISGIENRISILKIAKFL